MGGYMSQHYKLAVLFMTAVCVTTFGAAASLQVNTVDSNGNDLQGASVAIDGPATVTKTTGSDGAATFNGIPAGDYDVTITLDGYEEREIEVTLYNDADNTVSIALEQGDAEGSLVAHVTDGSGNDRQAVAVVAENTASGERFREDTNRDGLADFGDIPVGEYEVFIDDPEFESDSIVVDVTEDHEVRAELTTRTQDTTSNTVQVRQLVVPDRVRQDAPYTVTVHVENTDSTSRTARVSVDAFGDSKGRSIALDGNETDSTSFTFDTGTITSDSARIQASVSAAGDTDRRSITVPVSRYAAFMNINPDHVTVGEPAYVTGRIEDIGTGEPGRGIVASLYFDGEFLTNIVSSQTGRFSAFVRPQTAGTHRVQLTSSSIYQVGAVWARPEITIETASAPSSVQNSAPAEACFDIGLAGLEQVALTFSIDGVIQDNRSVSVEEGQQYCYDLRTQVTGDHTATLRAHAEGASRAHEVEYTVMAPTTPINMTVEDVRVNQSATTTVTATLINPTTTERTVNVSLTGLDASWTEEIEQQVTVPAEGNTSVQFSVTPHQSGTFAPSIVVTDGGAERRTGFQVQVIGDTRQSILDTLERGLWENWKPLVALIVIAVIGYIVRRDVREWLSPTTLEPQQR